MGLSHKDQKRLREEAAEEVAQAHEAPERVHQSSSTAAGLEEMQFLLVDRVNVCRAQDIGESDSRCLFVSAAHSGAVDLTDYARLVAYARSTFVINPELAIVLRAPVRAALFFAPVRAPSRLLLGHAHCPCAYVRRSASL